MTDTPELLPCPFCGGEAHPMWPEEYGCNWVRCRQCMAEGPYQKENQSTDEAIAAWNRRVNDE